MEITPSQIAYGIYDVAIETQSKNNYFPTSDFWSNCIKCIHLFAINHQMVASNKSNSLMTFNELLMSLGTFFHRLVILVVEKNITNSVVAVERGGAERCINFEGEGTSLLVRSKMKRKKLEGDIF